MLGDLDYIATEEDCIAEGEEGGDVSRGIGPPMCMGFLAFAPKFLGALD